jgi:transcriptional regulator with XRE-family HTH domain
MGFSVPRKKIVQHEGVHFGERLASLRKTAGLSQSEIGRQIGASQRMIAYYESRAPLPPGHVLAALAAALNTTVDELMGNKPARPSKKKPSNERLWRRFAQIEQLPLRDRKELFSVIDAYLERHRLQRAS